LGSLDDKIELNRRMNATLEGMAQALFKSWFVDFDPVIDNALAAGNPIPDELAPRAEVRKNALANGTANREAAKPFPAAFHETESMGWIPKGWEVSSLGDILQQRVERVKPSTETAAIPYVPIECISPHSLFLENTKDGIEAQSSLTKFHKGDILFGAMRPYFHKVCIAPFDGTTRTTAFVLSSKNDSDWAFGAALANEESTIEYATLHSEGSTIPYAKWRNSLERMPIILPPSGLRSEFGGKVAALLNAISPKFYQNVALTELRDTLLPKLISGELRIPEAEQLIEKTLDV
jgi:type I restriction enzyme S subunit